MTTQAKSTDGATHRITQLDVNEMSMVDAPANKKPFITIKSDTMPQELLLNEDGTLEKGGFSSANKAKMKSALKGAISSLSALMDKIDDAEDEAAMSKSIAGAMSKLKPYMSGGGKADDNVEAGGKGGAEDKSKTEKSLPHQDEALDAIEQTIADERAAMEAEREKAEKDAKDDAVAKRDAKIDTLTKAVLTLTDVVKGKGQNTEPAKPTSSTQEEDSDGTEVKKTEDPWNSISAYPIDEDERFV